MKIFILKSVFLSGVFFGGLYTAQHTSHATSLKRCYDEENHEEPKRIGRSVY